MGRYHDAETSVSLTAQRRCQLAGRRFREDDQITVLLGESFDEQGEGFGQGGPWGCGGFTSRYVLRIADRITEDQRGQVIYELAFERGTYRTPDPVAASLAKSLRR